MNLNTIPGLIADLDLARANLQRVEEHQAEVLDAVGRETDFFVRSAAGVVLQDFYNTVEKSLQRIAIELDGAVPTGDAWHQQLVQRMTVAIPGRRPAVLDQKLAMRLSEFLRFRHLFRSIYGFDLDWSRIEPLLTELPLVIERFSASLDGFRDYLLALFEEDT